MARSYDKRNVTPPTTRGPKRQSYGRVTPGDDIEVSREIERLWAGIEKLNVKPSSGGVTSFIALWLKGGALPIGTGASGGVWRVPYVAGASITVTFTRASFRTETAPVSGTYTLKVQRSPAGSTFTATDVCTLSITSADQDDTTTTFAVPTAVSGQLLRVTFTGVGSGANIMSVQLEGTAA